LPANNDVYRGYEEAEPQQQQHQQQLININAMKNMPNNIMGNMRKNSGNLNGVSADDESSDSDHEYFVYKNYLIGLLRIKIFIIRIFKQFNLIFVFIYCAFIQQRIFFKFLSIEFLISLILFIST
jgi:hypothetical protein